jgi:flagellar basal body-associated protein FliL
MSKPAPEAPASGEAPPPGKSLVKKLRIPGIILAIVLVEAIAAYLYLPGAPQPSQAAANPSDENAATEEGADDEHGAGKDDAHGSEGHKAKDDHGADKKEDGHGGHGGHGEEPKKKVTIGDQTEIDLGQYNVTGYQPVSNTTLIITFHLYGTVKTKHSDDFAQRFEESKHRVRDNIIAIVRSAEVTDLTDAGLGLIKRRVLETTNKTLGKPLVQSVMFSEFSFFEQ